MDKTENIEKIFQEMLETYKAKNTDYGDSFSKSYKEFGLTAPIIRIGDKYQRLKTLSSTSDIQVKDESIRDTLKDLANYAVMTMVELDVQEPKAINPDEGNEELVWIGFGLKTRTFRGYRIYIRHRFEYLGRNSYYCGYVVVPKNHPFYEKDYDELDPYITVHGGLTFSGYHSGISMGEYLLGFDCRHAGDDISECDEEYVLGECMRLVNQLINAEYDFKKFDQPITGEVDWRTDGDRPYDHLFDMYVDEHEDYTEGDKLNI